MTKYYTINNGKYSTVVKEEDDRYFICDLDFDNFSIKSTSKDTINWDLFKEISREELIELNKRSELTRIRESILKHKEEIIKLERKIIRIENKNYVLL